MISATKLALTVCGRRRSPLFFYGQIPLPLKTTITVFAARGVRGGGGGARRGEPQGLDEWEHQWEMEAEEDESLYGRMRRRNLSYSDLEYAAHLSEQPLPNQKNEGKRGGAPKREKDRPLTPFAERAMAKAAGKGVKKVPEEYADEPEDWAAELGGLANELPRDEARRPLKQRDAQKRQRYPRIDFHHVPVEQRIVLLFPDQGAQHVGMGEKVMDHPSAKRVFEEASAFLSRDVSALCQKGPQTALDQIVNAQLAVFTASVAAFEKFKAVEAPDLPERLTDALGFGVGEFAALVAAGCLSFGDALRLVKLRAEAMAECAQLVPSGQLSVRVFAASRLDDAIEDARRDAMSKEGGLWSDLCAVSAFLYCGVKLVGGSEHCLRFLEQNAHNYKFHVVKRLPPWVPAFHTPLMADAGRRLFEAFIIDPIPSSAKGGKQKEGSPQKRLTEAETEAKMGAFPVESEEVKESTGAPASEVTENEEEGKPTPSPLTPPAETTKTVVDGGVRLRHARCNVYSCRTGKVHGTSVRKMPRNIAEQVCAPVHWEQCVQDLLGPYFRRNLERTRKQALDDEFPVFWEVGPSGGGHGQLGPILFQASKKAHHRFFRFSA